MNEALILTILFCFTSILSNTRAPSFEKNSDNCLEAYYGKPEEEMKALKEVYDKEVAKQIAQAIIEKACN